MSWLEGLAQKQCILPCKEHASRWNIELVEWSLKKSCSVPEYQILSASKQDQTISDHTFFWKVLASMS